MSSFKKETELRRIIFGLVSLLTNIPAAQLPPVILQKVGDIGLELVNLINRCHAARLKSVTENEKFIEKGGFSSSGEECSSDEMEDEMDPADDEKDFLET
mgnify:CR=1 FL=1